MAGGGLLLLLWRLLLLLLPLLLWRPGRWLWRLRRRTWLPAGRAFSARLLAAELPAKPLVSHGDFVSSLLCFPSLLWLLDLVPCLLRGFCEQLSLLSSRPLAPGFFALFSQGIFSRVISRRRSSCGARVLLKQGKTLIRLNKNTRNAVL